jgi:hypothetical protein
MPAIGEEIKGTISSEVTTSESDLDGTRGGFRSLDLVNKFGVRVA